jgi:Zn-dependent M28 family amino/carboxypeptidase
MLIKKDLIRRLDTHLNTLTRTIGERSVRRPENLERSAAYIAAQFDASGLPVERQPYRYRSLTVSNVAARLGAPADSGRHLVVGAHYDSVAGTVGADDNASAVAVLLETARGLRALTTGETPSSAITFVAFALEEPPTYGTRHMGSRVFAAEAHRKKMPIDAMICLEMVGYTCPQIGCQQYPLPLRWRDYPKTGSFIGVIGNLKSWAFTRELCASFRRNPHLPVVGLTVPFNGWILPAVRLSDHASFWRYGYRAVMLTDTAFFRNPHYHLPSDTMETLDLDFMAELVLSLVSFLQKP